MLGLFFFSAIFNLALGYVVGRYVSPRSLSGLVDDIQRRLWSWRRRTTSGEPEAVAPGMLELPGGPPETPAPASGADKASATGSVESPGAQPSDAKSSDAAPDAVPDVGTDVESSDAESSDWTDSPDWKELDASVAQLNSRIEYVQSIDDKTLAQQAVKDFQEALSVWHGKLSALLEDEDTESTMDLAELMLLEQFVAQLETTLANLNELDWTDDLETIVARVEKELRTLDETRPQLASETG